MVEHRPRQPRVTVVVPAYNEARNLEIVLPRLRAYHQVVIVDGGSSDDTVSTVRRVAPWAELVEQSRKGKGNALVCGFTRATGDVIVMFDADGSADWREIDLFVQALVDGADFAKGSRALQAGGSDDLTVFRGLGNRGLTVLTNVMFRARFTDLCYGYNAFWRDVLPKLDLPGTQPGEMVWGDGFEIETVLNCRVARAGLTVREVPSHELNRIHGGSNLRAIADGVRVLRTIWTEWRRPVAGQAQVEEFAAHQRQTRDWQCDDGTASSSSHPPTRASAA